ncbi:hypothetical protein AVEN_142432-1 [Araneus ventricosus]|uniref:Uncharacterized protein n=1 Tax=Araneus ventricosus TaxID=182803 RepID=A0A4Y2VAG9_ARAVE|nr:hypothetical protein AVEN_2651-1 [Araneus ventricosus]GBO22295.1 hypothetical protein AVEN_142432-1 [Araneus ventricosus]
MWRTGFIGYNKMMQALPESSYGSVNVVDYTSCCCFMSPCLKIRPGPGNEAGLILSQGARLEPPCRSNNSTSPLPSPLHSFLAEAPMQSIHDYG